jgi:multimeric flavodoxin WrbA
VRTEAKRREGYSGIQKKARVVLAGAKLEVWQMKILGIVGSMRKNRTTGTLVERVISEIETLNREASSEILYTSDLQIRPCRVICSSYCIENPFNCSLEDELPSVLERMIQADVLVLATPLYFRAPPAQFQAFAERLISIFFFQETQGRGDVDSPLAGKPCGLIGVAEYSNPQGILEYLHDFCTVLKMRPVRLDSFPYLGVAGRGDIGGDKIFQPLARAKELAAAIAAV